VGFEEYKHTKTLRTKQAAEVYVFQYDNHYLSVLWSADCALRHCHTVRKQTNLSLRLKMT